MKKSEVSRRKFVKTTIAGATLSALGVLGGRAGQAADTEKLQINVAGYAKSISGWQPENKAIVS